MPHGKQPARPSALPPFSPGLQKARDTTEKPSILYVALDDSDDDPTMNGKLAFSSPRARRGRQNARPVVVSVEDEDEEDSASFALPQSSPIPARVSLAGPTLRPRASLNLFQKATENGKRNSIKRRKAYAKKPVHNAAPLPDSRQGIRLAIAAESAVKRTKFFLVKKDYFLPLLPENNHITRLLSKENAGADANAHNGGTGHEDDQLEPYQEIEDQPQGITATMKAYQLSGLSFLVYLHRNGLSGILGDEMGLGKTLQTLSLFQYLKERRKTTGQPRPFLVVCPLSVLSSWMAEARKWAPGLKVLRFHGPTGERTRLKKVVEGKEDFYGNETARARQKRNERRTAAGKPLIALDSDSGASGLDTAVDVVVTTYETFSAEQVWFKRAFVWTYAVLDEGHKIKNDLSMISSALQGLQAEYRLILTGTPLQNNLTELWTLLHWLYPEVFTVKTAEIFRKSFNLTQGQINTTVMDDSRRLLELIMLRRMKSSPGVDLNLPPKTEVVLFVPLTPMQRFWYERLLTRADQGLLEEVFQSARDKEKAARTLEVKEEQEWERKGLDETQKVEQQDGAIGDEWEESKDIMRRAIEQESQDHNQSSAWRKLMNLLMQLRKCCNHPYSLPNAEPTPYVLGEHIIRASGKFIVLDKLIRELVVKQGKKILIFSGFTSMLDYCEDLLSLRGGDGHSFNYCRLDGGTGRARRNLGIRMFNDRGSNYKVMLISTRAGALGINLASASDVVMMDQDWNPQITLQAEARAHRIGQTQPVTVYKLCTQGTVEEQMMGRIQKKLYLSAKVTESMRDIHTGGGKSGKRGGKAKAEDDMPHLDTGALMSMVRRGAQTLARPQIDVNEMLNWDWATMLEKCKDQAADVHVSKQTQGDDQVDEQAEQKWLAEVEAVSTSVFDGKKYTRENKLNDNKAVQREWDRKDRRVGKNTTVMVDGFAISKESMGCGDWEAVPTLAGKDARLAEVKRAKRKEVVNQEHCQVCWDGGELLCCTGCPRSYHYDCLNKETRARTKSKMSQFYCGQHQCFDCGEKTTNAGGMLYRCRWCERAYCEDCLELDRADLIGDSLMELETLGLDAISQAFYVRCPDCKDVQEGDPSARKFCADMLAEFCRKHQEMLEAEGRDDAPHTTEAASRAHSLTDATTVESSGVNTPTTVGEKSGFLGKRKASMADIKSEPAAKRARG
ncbi:MAG: hypothetical protein M1832_005305 [Thelocarpon impressellum]|nr:MAG: hypothetical protein M1832_005305 [Thelocarpon impressellum]